jgi:hypothetical protein
MPGRNSFLLIAAALLLGAFTTGCATITKGSSQSITINTDPPGANCTMSREGAMIGAVAQTPGTLLVEKDKDAITVNCKKEGYFESALAMEASIQGMTFGNILFGGIVGVAIDGVSGALHQYPPMLTVLLTPDAFDSAENRDKFFDRRRLSLLEEHGRTEESILKNCEAPDCEAQTKVAKEQMNNAMVMLEQKRTLARVRQ